MTTPFWCLLIGILIPYVLAGTTGYFRTQQLGALDNKHPRQQAARLEGAGARAVAAQMNAWEALPIFAVAVIVAHLGGVDPGTAAMLSLAWLGARILHAVFYLANLDYARSGIFFVAWGAAIWLFVAGASGLS